MSQDQLSEELSSLIKILMDYNGTEGHQPQADLVDFILENQQDLVSALAKAESITAGIYPQI